MYIKQLNTERVIRHKPQPGDMFLLYKKQGTISYGLNPGLDNTPKMSTYKVVWDKKNHDNKILIKELVQASEISEQKELELFTILADFFARSNGMKGITIRNEVSIIYAILE